MKVACVGGGPAGLFLALLLKKCDPRHEVTVYERNRADSGAARVTLEAAMAKSFATEAAQAIVDDSMQVLGGAGVLAAHPVDRLYRSVRALRIYEGTTEIQSLVIAGQLLAEDGA